MLSRTLRSSTSAARAVAAPRVASSSFATSSRAMLATPAPEKKMVTLTIDGKEVTVPQGTALIQACEQAGAQIPRFCYHERLLIAGNCRMCLVESKGAPKPIASCAWPVQPGQVVSTTSPLVAKAREGVMEFLLANHPLDCPICDWGGECDLQDQSMRYGSDRGRMHEVAGKRAVEDKNLGPLVKTVMTRCIQCTRCVRFANDVAGVQDLGTSGRGNDLQIGTYVEKSINSEMSGNMIDLCPVGALTSKPYAFTARPWELKKSESIDVLDAVGSNIRVDSRGVQVMRVLPRLNEDVNEEWINDKTRYAADGLKYQRLTTPLIKQGDRFVPASWPEALATVAEGLEQSGAKGDEIKGVVGSLADAESMVALKDLMNRLGSENVTVDQPAVDSAAPIYSQDFRSNYMMNSTISGLEEADALLLVGTNPRHEAAIVNTRIRKGYLHNGLDVGLIGEKVDLTYDYAHVGSDAQAVRDFVAGKGEFAKLFGKAKKPMIIVGSGVAEHVDGKAILSDLATLVEKNKDRMLTQEWNGLNFLQRTASRTAANDIGIQASNNATNPKFVYLLGADDVSPESIPADSFVVYQGHHGDVGASLADVVLPSAAYTEKNVTYVNTEGRTQQTRAAVSPPGAAREDWKVIRALSEVCGATLPYEDLLDLRDRMFEVSPSLVRYDVAEPTSREAAEVALAGMKALGGSGKTAAKISGAPLLAALTREKFYTTDPVSRASPTMAQCVEAFVKEVPMEHTEGMVNVAPLN
ncbi:putative NADH dehydrogenase 78K chain precursor [Jaminaea rosea]|uniref:NADH-ubiquinone oxidoreductase 78 kDa subunit, mitochondrial n=1 Tax=Jaminaea rosea TaxID=1569628 RepID=A0A316UQY7_9BASI|nr:putative NADH dehydrogenase 78K chain precursor [Jaminaea rosea]PWN27394.1 putative NADH dehydrogenase 78K chain precursor [Jaminaea rosea]